MVLKSNMKFTVRLFLFLLLTACFSCEEYGLIINCPDCTENEPLDTNIDIKVDLNPGTATLINVYEGNLEDSVLYSSYNTSASKTSVLVTINKKYTFTATYYILSDKYVAVDSATPRVKFNKDQCDNPCYFVYDRICDLRLKPGTR